MQERSYRSIAFPEGDSSLPLERKWGGKQKRKEKKKNEGKEGREKLIIIAEAGREHSQIPSSPKETLKEADLSMEVISPREKGNTPLERGRAGEAHFSP